MNTPTTAIVIAIVATLLGWIPAALQAGENADPDGAAARAKQFDALDKNDDGSLSKDEFMAARKSVEEPERASKVFELRDTDGDGSLSKEEFVNDPKGGKTGTADESDGG
jgi:Ca2+-binding EF-hand superfamily protein